MWPFLRTQPRVSRASFGGGAFFRFWGLFLPAEVSLVLEKLTNCVSQNAGALGH